MPGGEGCLFFASCNWGLGPPQQGSHHSPTWGACGRGHWAKSSWLLAWVAADQASVWWGPTFMPWREHCRGPCCVLGSYEQDLPSHWLRARGSTTQASEACCLPAASANMKHHFAPAFSHLSASQVLVTQAHELGWLWRQ